MTIIPTANVYISFSKTPMLQFLKGSELAVKKSTGMSVEEFQEAGMPDEKDVFTFSNSNLEDEGSLQISDFSHEIGYEGGNTMNITLLDPKREFEKRIFVGSLISELAAYGEEFPGFSEGLRDPIQAQRYLYLINIPDSVKGQLDPQLKLLREAKEKPGKTIYVVYGVGKDPNTWSGPHKMTVVNAKIEAKDIRKIKLRLVSVPMGVVPSQNPTSYGTQMRLPSTSPTTIVGYSKRFTNLRLTAGKVADGYVIQGVTDAQAEDLKTEARYPNLFYGDLGDYMAAWRTDNFAIISDEHPHLGGEVKQFIASVDIHRVVTDTVKNFVQKATANPNVVVLFPNLNIILAPLIEEYIIKLQWTSEDWAKGSQEGIQTYFRKTANVTQAVLHRIGLAFGMEPERTEEGTQPVIPAGDLNRFKKSPTNSEWKVFYAQMQGRLGPGDGEDPSVYQKLQELFSNLNKWGAALYSAQYGVITESTTEKVGLWQQLQKESNPSPANNAEEHYGGVAATFDALLHDKALDHAVTIVGSMSMITQFIYGQKRLSTKHKEDITDEYLSDNFNDVMIGFAHYPLHKADYILGEPENNKKLREQTFERHKKMMEDNAGFAGAFRSPDYFAFSEGKEGEAALDRIKQEGVPMFKYNTQSPNVTKLIANYNPGYWAALQRMQPMVKMDLFATPEDLEGELRKPFSELSVDKLKARSRVAQISQGAGEGSIREAILAGLTEEAKNSDVGAAFQSQEMIEDLQILMAHQLENVDNPLFGSLWVNQIASSDQDMVTAQGELLQALFRMVNQVSVSTLPMFAYSDASFLFKEAILLAQFPNMRQTTARPDSPLDTFLSGVYRLSGFKHTISPKKVESQFKMVKNSI